MLSSLLARTSGFVRRHSWWAILFAGCAVIVVLGLAKVHLPGRRGLTVDTGWTVLALSGLWLVTCIFAVALTDLIERFRHLISGGAFVELPGNIKLPGWSLPWLVPTGFTIGLFVGHFFW